MARPMTEVKAQALHDRRQAARRDHDRISCWCCCIDCDFDTRAVIQVTAPLLADGLSYHRRYLARRRRSRR